MLSGASYNLIENNVVCANVRDIYDDLTGLGNLGDLNYCDVTSGYADSGQTSGCDYECSGCRKAENDLVVTENTQLCPYTYNIEDIGSVGVIIIGAHGVELDCRGAEIIGVSADSGYGIRNIGYDNVTIRNCKIYNYFIAIDFYSAADSARVLNNDVSSNAGGIRLWGSNYGYIGGNIANLNSQHGIVLTQNSDFNTIRNNVAEVNSISGIIAYAGSDYNTIELNDVASNYYGIYIHDSDQNYVHNNVVEDNTNTGVYFTATANNNELRHNRICANSLDISDEDNNYGDDNFCGTTNNWNDDGAEGCTFSCLLGDIDVDGDVDRYDFGIFALAYGSTAGDPSYELGADLDCDDDVDRYDFGIFALNYGKTS
jgi:parallel beta-helix repeat protein